MAPPDDRFREAIQRCKKRAGLLKSRIASVLTRPAMTAIQLHLISPQRRRRLRSKSSSVTYVFTASDRECLPCAENLQVFNP